MRRRRLLAIAGAALGLGLFGWFVARIGLEDILDTLGRLGWLALLVPLPQAFSYVFDTLGWKASFRPAAARLPLPLLYHLRLAGESVNYLTPTAYVGGEPVKAVLVMRRGVSGRDAVTSVVVAKTLMTLAEILFLVIAAACALDSIPPASPLFYGFAIVILAGSLAIVLLLRLQRRGLLMSLLRLARRLRLRITSLETRAESLAAIDDEIGRFYAEDRRRFWMSIGFHLLGWITGAVEIYLVSGWLGAPMSLFDAIAIEGCAAFIKGVTLFVPGSIGFQEAGFVLLYRLFGLAAESGAAFGLVRRGRELLFGGIGLLGLMYEGARARRLRPDDGSECSEEASAKA